MTISLQQTLACVVLLLVTSCANVPVRSRLPPERVIVREAIYREYFDRNGKLTASLRFGEGVYSFAWEDDSYWYFLNSMPGVERVIERMGGRISGPGGFAFDKKHDQVQIFVLADYESLRVHRRIPEGLLLAHPKREGKLIRLDGILPNDVLNSVVLSGTLHR